MKTLIQRIFKFIAYSAAGIVILLAIIVGLFRLFLPRLPEYQEEIKSWASTAIGMEVEFSGMDARWGLSGPELKFYNAELLRQDTQVRMIAAEEVSFGVGLMRLLVDRTLVVDRVVVRETSIEVRQLDSGQWMIQGSLIEELRSLQESTGRDVGEIEFIGQNIELLVLQPQDQRPRTFAIQRLQVRRDEVRLAVDATLQLPQEIGRRLAISATQLLLPPAEERSWDINIEADDLRLAGLSRMHELKAGQFDSGSGSINLSLVYSEGLIRSATADLEFDEILHPDGVQFDVSGRLEFARDENGWLLAADDFQLTTPVGQWPRSSLQFEASTGRDGQVVMIDARASYINLGDAALLGPWLNDQQNELRMQLDTSGVVRDLAATLSDVDTDAPRYDVSAKFFAAGIAAYKKIPGVRGFSGSLRADRAGGLLELNSEDMSVSLPNYLAQSIVIDTAVGTIIWRRSSNRLTFLSDSIAIRNADFESESNVELILSDDGSAPVIDLESIWSVADISAAKRYLPEKVIAPKPYEWLQQALVSGRISRGKTLLYGPLDKFPFDNGEGRLLIEANVRDATLLYHSSWPAAELIDLDVSLENLRLFSTQSRSSNVGIEVVDAKIEIADFRDPVLIIDTFATGTLESIRQFSIQSPIGQVFGGQLDKVAVSGDASFDLSLVVPIRDILNFEFTTRIHSNDGTLQVEGLSPPVNQLNGYVTIDRDTISSESLSGEFLGRPVSIDLGLAPESMPDYRVVVNTSGVATVDGLIEGFGIPLENILSGATEYKATLFFPRGGQEIPPPFRIEIESDLVGFTVDVPDPFTKVANEPIAVFAAIEFPADAETILTAGTAGDLLAWQAAFVRIDQSWDFDRGALSVGGEPLIAAETKGLHVRGNTDEVRLQDWLDLSDRGDGQLGVVERVRSVDVTVDNLYLLGQHIVDHRVRVDRSGQDWSVQFDGDAVSGSVVIPYEFTAERVMVLDMDRLILAGEDPDTAEPARTVDPRSLPAISLRAAEFAFGSRFLGSVEATFERTENGLEAANIVVKDETFKVAGSGSWIVDPTDPAGFRSSIKATLSSTDIESTMQRLDYAPGIIGEDLTIDFGLSWSGGPREDFMDSLDGEVHVRLGAGQLAEVEPGAGRVFGLMSVGALPRRLSLDFSDIFDKGFGFDSIMGDFRVAKGEAYTCNLSLEGPAADIGIVGRASLVNRDYDQTAVVSPSVGNTLPIVGAVIAGPQVAAVLLIFSQIFKKPLQEMGQVFYSISGSFDEPVVDSMNAEMFAAHAALAECIQE